MTGEGQRGRPPKPAERRAALAKGDGQTPGHRATESAKTGKAIQVHPSNVRTPQRGSQSLPEAPADLGERGVTEWDNIWSAGRAWLHPTEDYHWVEQIAHAYDDLVAFRDEVARTGLIVKGYNGQKTANPLIKEARALEATIRICLSKLGFSPTDRARLALGEIQIEGGLRALQQRTKDNRSSRPGQGTGTASA